MAFDSSSPSTIVIGNSVRDTPIDPIVPQFLEDSSGLVTHYLALNESFANSAFADAQEAIAAVGQAVFPLTLPNPPEPPTVISNGSVSAGLNFDAAPAIQTLEQSAVAPFSPATIVIDDVTDEIPDYVPVITGISIPDAPVAQPVTMPTEPTVETDFTVPTAPVSNYGTSPVLTTYDLPIYVPPVLPLFNETAPTFDETPPSPVIQWVEPQYSSDIQDAVKLVLEEMLAGGTGIPEAVERAIWQRGREREDDRSEQEIAAAIAQWTTRGFSHPPGQLNAQIIVLRDTTGRKVNELSREVMVTQANLEQKNRQFAVQYGVDYERVFTTVFLAIVDRNFQIAKFSVESQIQIYNMLVTTFNVEQQIFAQKVLLYRTQLEAAFADIKAFEAQVAAVKAGADMNIAITQVYSEKVKAYATEVDAYGAVVKAETEKANLQRIKVELYKAQIDGVVAEIQAQRETFLAYDSKIKGETSKVQLEEANSRAYVAQVQAIGERATIIVKNADAQISRDRLNLDWNIANMQRITTLNGQQVALAQTELAAYEAVNRKAETKYRATVEGQRASLQTQIELGRLQIAKYDTLTSQWRSRVQELIQMSEISAQSLRAAGQMASTLAAGAMAGTHVSAGISASGSASQSSSRAVSDQTAHSEAYNSGYNVNHSYAHKT
jgi:hypothetical protein